MSVRSGATTVAVASPTRAGYSAAGDLGLLSTQVLYEQRAFWRNRVRGFFTVLFPVMFLVIFASLNSNSRISSRGGVPYVTFFVPGILAFGIISATFTNMAIGTAILRDEGVLKRLRGTPIPGWVYMGGRIASSIVTMFVLVVTMVVIGWAAYGVHLRAATLPGLVLAVIVGAACFTALGLAVTVIIPNADAAPVVVNAIFLPLSFISNIWFPADTTRWLTDLGSIFPIRALADALQIAYAPHTTAPGIVGHDLWVMAIWLAGGLIVVRRWFRWESGRQ